MKLNKTKTILTALLVAVIAVTSFTGCTAQQRAKKFGGTVEINLPANQELVTATWKDADLWYLTRPRKAGETADTLTFKESSAWGIAEGTIIFREK